MAKDPATLWYWNDFLTGTMTLNKHQIGCYVILLGAQFNSGHLSITEIKTVLGPDFDTTWPVLQKKFKQDGNGLFYNEKAEETKNKRANYTKSRRQNLKPHMEPHMGAHMENENEIENRRLEFVTEVEKLLVGEDSETIKDFCGYWTERSAKGKKMRFEKETVFDISRRFGTWKRNNFNRPSPTSKHDQFEDNLKAAENL